MAGPAAITIELAEHERDELKRWTRRRKTAQALATRARIVLAAADGLNNAQICAKLGVCRPTVQTWRKRFAERGLEGLDDEPRSGRPRTIDDARVHVVVTRTLETKTKDATHWSTRTLAEELGLSQSTVSRIWRAFNLQPHRTGTFKLSTDPWFVEKVRDVVGLYMDRESKALVLRIDEKSQVQALDRTQSLLPMRPGSPERRTHEYVRHGTTDLPPPDRSRFGDTPIWAMEGIRWRGSDTRRSRSSGCCGRRMWSWARAGGSPRSAGRSECTRSRTTAGGVSPAGSRSTRRSG